MLDKIINFLNDKQNVFLSGGAGTGKSYLTKNIIHHFKNNDKNVVSLGSTGISAVNIGGMTVHSFFRFGLSKNLDELILIDKKQKHKLNELKQIISNIDLLIIDEISMISANSLDMIVFRLKNFAFKGALLFVGDFYQLAPVVKKDENLLFSTLYAFESLSWNELKFKNIMLKKSKRTTNLYFYSLLEKMRKGICDDEILKFFHLKLINNLPNDILALFGKNNKVDFKNSQELHKIPACLYALPATLEVYDKTLNDNTLQNWKKNISLPEILEIKLNAKVMICANKRGYYYNGEIGEVVEICDDCIQILKNNEIVQIEKTTIELNEFSIDDNGAIKTNTKATFRQFPLRLAYAISIHKSQGLSIDRFVCDIDDIFAYGQLYVALSRSTNPDEIYLTSNKKNVDFYIKNSLKTNDIVNKFYENSNFIEEDI